METGDSVGVYEKLEVTVNKKLLEDMVYFKDPKKRRDCAGRVSKGKKAKSGKRLHLPSLRGLETEEKFIVYIKAIGFEWLLEHSMVEVPLDLTNEFFTSFQFKHITNLDADSISFRNLREWSLSMGLLTQEEDREGAWNEREIGRPEHTASFDIGFFINTGHVTREGSTLQFYEVGQAEGGPMKVEQEAEVRPTATEETWKYMMEEMLRRLGEATVVQRICWSSRLRK